MERSFIPHFYSGTSGIVLPFPKSQFPEPFRNSDRLTYYSSLYNSLEVNSSFYRVPKLSTVYKWALSVPDDFRFTFKLWEGITHKKQLEFDEKDVEHFLTVIGQVGTKKGCLLIQLPPSRGNEYIGQLEKLLKTIRKMDVNEWKIAVEFRNNSWYDQSTMDVLKSFNAALVVHDMPESATPPVVHSTDFMYVRFHGPTGKYDGGYNKEYLDNCSISLSNWVKEGKEVYVYFNNTIGDALKNLDDLNQLVLTKQKSNA